MFILQRMCKRLSKKESIISFSPYYLQNEPYTNQLKYVTVTIRPLLWSSVIDAVQINKEWMSSTICGITPIISLGLVCFLIL